MATAQHVAQAQGGLAWEAGQRYRVPAAVGEFGDRSGCEVRERSPTESPGAVPGCTKHQGNGDPPSCFPLDAAPWGQWNPSPGKVSQRRSLRRYDRTKLTLKDIHNCQYVACMNPTAGSFTIDSRLQVRRAAGLGTVP